MMKNLLMLIFVLSSFCAFAQQGNNILIRGEGTTQISINNRVPISKLYNPGDNFENLEPLGPPISKKCTQTFAYEICVFVYDGFTLTFTNIHGSPELTEMVVHGPEVQIDFLDYKLKKGLVPTGLLEENNHGRRKGLTVEHNHRKSKKEKFGNEYSYLEIKLDEENSVDSIFYVRHIL